MALDNEDKEDVELMGTMMGSVFKTIFEEAMKLYSKENAQKVAEYYITMYKTMKTEGMSKNEIMLLMLSNKASIDALIEAVTKSMAKPPKSGG